MALTYVLLARNTIGSGGVTIVEFDNIPQFYTDLVISFQSRDAAEDSTPWNDIFVTFNDDNVSTGTSYNTLLAYANPETGTNDFTSFSSSANNIPWVFSNKANTTNNTFSNNYMYIPNYASSRNKTLYAESLVEQNASSGIISFIGSSWINTNPITKIAFRPSASFMQNSMFTLYGIKKD